MSDATASIRYLTFDDAIEAIRSLASRGVGPIRDVGLLDGALARPRASAFGEDAYPTIALKAAALGHSIAKNHSLVDGNKRLALLLTMDFLDLNGCRAELSDDEAFDLVIGVAAGAIDDLAMIAEQLRLAPS